MNPAAPLLLSLLVGTAALGQAAPPDPMPFDAADHRWTHRLLYVFAPSGDHPDLVAQRQMATGFVDGFRDRDLLFVSVLERGGGESVGHRSGRRIVEIKRTKKDDLTDSDLDHMSEVVGYIKRHKAQVPSSDIAESDWRYSLMNWGHDPCNDGDIEC